MNLDNRAAAVALQLHSMIPAIWYGTVRPGMVGQRWSSLDEREKFPLDTLEISEAFIKHIKADRDAGARGLHFFSLEMIPDIDCALSSFNGVWVRLSQRYSGICEIHQCEFMNRYDIAYRWENPVTKS